MPVFSRLSARTGNDVDLDVTFLNGGIPTDPYAITRVDIYKQAVLDANLVATYLLPNPCNDTGYPSPIDKVTETIPAGDCGTEAEEGAEVPGKYKITWSIPNDIDAPNVFFDVWSYIPTNPCLLDDFSDSANCVDGCYTDLSDTELDAYLQTCCHRFWVQPNAWYCTDALTNFRLGFEPLDQKFRQPEHRPIEVGIMPLPLYDYDYNLYGAILPNLTATIKITTQFNEVVVDNAAMTLKLRQGSFRTNPYVFSYLINTASFYKGTYQYRITVVLPDGTSRVSGDFILTIS